MTRPELVEAGAKALRMAGIRINLYKTEDDAVEAVLDAVVPLILADLRARVETEPTWVNEHDMMEVFDEAQK